MRLSVALLICSPAFAASPYTLEQILSSAFPSELTASPDGAKLAWANDEKGLRNLWVAEAPGFQGRQLTHFNEDDGLEITGVEWNADGSAIVFVRGEGVNTRGEYPNPRSLPAGISQTIWVAKLDGAAKQLAEGSSPVIAPDGKSVAYVSKGEVWTVLIDGSSKAANLIHARGAAQLPQWSPDGQWLAFISNRRNHSFVALYSVARKSLLFPDASVDQDSYPVWSPDSKSIAYVRVPVYTKEFAFGPVRERDEPWSIRVYNLDADKAHEVWHAQPGPGSAFHEVVAHTQLQWASGNRIVFPWERDGFVHLYSAAAEGSAATLLTPGNFEVEHVALSRNGRDLVFSSNQNDMDRRHIWRVPAGGGKPSEVTKGDGIEWSPVETTGGIAYLHSNASGAGEARACFS